VVCRLRSSHQLAPARTPRPQPGCSMCLALTAGTALPRRRHRVGRPPGPESQSGRRNACNGLACQCGQHPRSRLRCTRDRRTKHSSNSSRRKTLVFRHGEEPRLQLLKKRKNGTGPVSRRSGPESLAGLGALTGSTRLAAVTFASAKLSRLATARGTGLDPQTCLTTSGQLHGTDKRIPWCLDRDAVGSPSLQ
jgi:hypothetical protein